MPEPRQLPTGTVTFLLTDIEGSTQLWERAKAQLDEAAWEKAWQEGEKMSIEQAIEYALRESQPIP